MISSIAALVVMLFLLTPITSHAAVTAQDPEDLYAPPAPHQDGSTKLPGIETYGNGVWDLVATETVTMDTAGRSNVHSMNGDGVKVCFRVVSGTANSFKVDLWEKDDVNGDDNYNGFNTENYSSYSSGTCAIYAGVGGDVGDEELYMTLYDGDTNIEKIELKWYD